MAEPVLEKRQTWFKNQNYYTLKRDCLQRSSLFEDETFKLNISESAEYDVVWLRPREICENPRFFVGGATRFDVIQGQLGDCWLLVAIANLTLNQSRFRYVVPTDQSFVEDYAGIFHFRIWQCGDWIEVVVDDRLPTVDGELLFLHSNQDNEFWSPLLEKAYAKVYGGYDLLKGGWFCESMVDLTGGMVESLSFMPPPPDLDRILLSAYVKSSFMCAYMKNDKDKKAEEITDKGLVKGHAYSVTKVINVNLPRRQEIITLIRMMNPWGNQEWNGAWSDSSPEWSQLSEEERLNLGIVNENDGEFWMCFSDFVSNFQYIDLCHLGPETFDINDDGEKWTAHFFKGEWIKNVNAGGNSPETIYFNPQFRIALTDIDNDNGTCTLIIALMQKNLRRNIWHRIGFTVIPLREPFPRPGYLSKRYVQSNLSQAIVSPFKHTREIVKRYEWPPGIYCIIPSTKMMNMEGQFLLRVFTEQRSTMEDIEQLRETDTENVYIRPLEAVEQKEHTRASIAEIEQTLIFKKSLEETKGLHVDKLVHRSDQEVKAFFNRITDRDKEVGWQKLQSVLQFALSPNRGLFTKSTDSNDVKFQKYECRTLIAMLDTDRSGKLDFDEFNVLWSRMRKWEEVFLKCSDHSQYLTTPELKQALELAGYRVSSRALGNMVREHADDAGRFTFNDFVMCAVELHTA